MMNSLGERAEPATECHVCPNGYVLMACAYVVDVGVAHQQAVFAQLITPSPGSDCCRGIWRKPTAHHGTPRARHLRLCKHKWTRLPCCFLSQVTAQRVHNLPSFACLVSPFPPRTLLHMSKRARLACRCACNLALRSSPRMHALVKSSHFVTSRRVFQNREITTWTKRYSGMRSPALRDAGATQKC